jgi:hypothetical protein
MARPGYSLGTKGGSTVKSLIVTLAPLGALTAFAAMSLKLRMPERGKFIGATLNVAARGGTHSNSALDVTNAGTSILGAAFDVDALTPGTPVDKEGSALAAAADEVAKDAELRITSTESGGTAPTWQGATLQLDYVPLGD